MPNQTSLLRDETHRMTRTSTRAFRDHRSSDGRSRPHANRPLTGHTHSARAGPQSNACAAAKQPPASMRSTSRDNRTAEQACGAPGHGPPGQAPATCP